MKDTDLKIISEEEMDSFPKGKRVILLVFVANPSALSVRLDASLTKDQLMSLKEEINATIEIVYGEKH